MGIVTNVMSMISSGLTAFIATMHKFPGVAAKEMGVSVGTVDTEGLSTGAADGSGPGYVTKGCMNT